MTLSCHLLAKENIPVEIKITEAFLELHKGPANEYRVEHVLLSGEVVHIKKQYADWFYLQQNEQVYGWATLATLLDNRLLNPDMSFDEFLINFEGETEFDLSFRAGFLQGDILLGFEAGHRFEDDMRVSLNIGEVPGKISQTRVLTLDLNFYFKRIKTLIPYLIVGGGQIVNKPSAQVIGGSQLSAAINKAGLGIVFAESKRISFSAQWLRYYPQSEQFDEYLEEVSVGLNYFY
ncbi:MAG: hypothetical protein OEY36_09080 [Gammaproteobacteria bacterium]|nr:hypothetical protein [Gammaproteobacteria bacterium]